MVSDRRLAAGQLRTEHVAKRAIRQLQCFEVGGFGKCLTNDAPLVGGTVADLGGNMLSKMPPVT